MDGQIAYAMQDRLGKLRRLRQIEARRKRRNLILVEAAAQVAGAAEDPRAALHLKLAQEQVAKAQALIADDENEDAARLIERAQADADLALLLAKESRSKQEAAKVREQIEDIKRRMQQ